MWRKRRFVSLLGAVNVPKTDGMHLNRPEVLCAVLVREPLWLEARMDDQALFEGIVVFSDEDGPGREAFISSKPRLSNNNTNLREICSYTLAIV